MKISLDVAYVIAQGGSGLDRVHIESEEEITTPLEGAESVVRGLIEWKSRIEQRRGPILLTALRVA